MTFFLAAKPKEVVMVKRFRFIDKRGRSIPSRKVSALKRRMRVKIMDAWGKMETPFYRGTAEDSALTAFLAKHADPKNPEVYFSQQDILNVPVVPYPKLAGPAAIPNF